MVLPFTEANGTGAKALNACSPPPPPSCPPSPSSLSPPLMGPTCQPRSSNLKIFKQGQARRCGHWKCLSWNAGGLSSALLDDLLAYAATYEYHIVFVQETHWRLQKTWVASGYMCIHGGNPHATSGDSSGLLTLISSRVCLPEMVRFEDVIPGRIQHVRIPSSKDTSFDMINVYQYTRKQSHMSGRASVWNTLGSLIERLPVRNGLLIMGDFNTDLRSRQPWVGPAIQTVHHTRKHLNDEFGDFLETYDLCAANSWAKNCSPTSIGIQGQACIDAAIMRRQAMTAQVRLCKVLRDFPLGRDRGQLSWHNPLHLIVPRWSRPESSPRKGATPKLDSDKMHSSCLLRDEIWHDCASDLSQALEVLSPENPASLNQVLMDVCLRHYGMQRSTPQASSHKDALRRWDLWRMLQALPGAGIRAIIKRWHIYCRFRCLSRVAKQHAKQRRAKRLEEIFQSALHASKGHNLRLLYQSIRKLSPKKLKRRLMLRSEDGSLLNPSQEIVLLDKYFRQCLPK